jgi:polyisoprenoid-binding protein YceI
VELTTMGNAVKPWNRATLSLAAAAIAFAGFVPTRAALAAEFVVRPGGGNKVVFVSKASIESFEGKTDRVEGRLTFDPSAIGDSLTAHLEVDLASLDTGIAKRNQHMRENHLETAKYPKAVFDGAAVHGPSGAKLEAGKPVTFDVEGTFTLHGVSRRLRISIEATYKPGAGAASGGSLAFRTEFPITLADYKISRPQFLFLKLAETQIVRVSCAATGNP